jgi:hypothetical protein
MNPVELAIFSLISLVFFNSVYNLFYDRRGSHSTTIAQLTDDPSAENRAPASTATSTFQNLDIKCEPSMTLNTSAEKIRLLGPLCGRGTKGASATVTKVSITNTANSKPATVFIDESKGKFTTDYIPLNPGPNPIHMEFIYKGGNQVTPELTVNKN